MMESAEKMQLKKLTVKNMKVADLLEYPDNARKITEDAVDYAAWSISEFGYNDPIIVGPDGMIASGHVRRRALIKLGVEEVSVVVADHLSKDELDAFRLADNKVASMAIWDKEKLQDKFVGIASQFSIEKLGFDRRMFSLPDDIGAGFDSASDGSGEDDGEVSVKNTSQEIDLDDFADDKFKHTCPHCGLKFN